MKNGKVIELTYEEAMTEPAYERIQTATKLLQTTSFEEMFPEKNMLGLKEAISCELKSFYESTTQHSLKDAVALAFSFLPDDTSASVLLEFTRFSIETWEGLTARKKTMA